MPDLSTAFMARQSTCTFSEIINEFILNIGRIPLVLVLILVIYTVRNLHISPCLWFTYVYGMYLCVTSLVVIFAGNPLMTDGFPSQRASISERGSTL